VTAPIAVVMGNLNDTGCRQRRGAAIARLRQNAAMLRTTAAWRRSATAEELEGAHEIFRPAPTDEIHSHALISAKGEHQGKIICMTHPTDTNRLRIVVEPNDTRTMDGKPIVSTRMLDVLTPSTLHPDADALDAWAAQIDAVAQVAEVGTDRAENDRAIRRLNAYQQLAFAIIRSTGGRIVHIHAPGPGQDRPKLTLGVSVANHSEAEILDDGVDHDAAPPWIPFVELTLPWDDSDVIEFKRCGKVGLAPAMDEIEVLRTISRWPEVDAEIMAS
jgi:hypothetical protein